MKIKLLFTFLVVMAGCAKSEDAGRLMSLSSDFEEMTEIPPTEQPAPQPPGHQNSESRKLIKNGTLEFETEDLQKTMTSIEQAAQSAGGYIANEHSTSNYNQFWNTITVRIPSSEFDNFIASVSKGVKKFDKREIKSQDVTEEFVDLQARIEAKKKLEQRYLEILQTASTVKDILQVEAEAGKSEKTLNVPKAGYGF